MVLASTTTALIPKYLIGKQDIHTVTDSNLLLPWVRANQSLDITIVGGKFRNRTESFIGPIAVETTTGPCGS